MEVFHRGRLWKSGSEFNQERREAVDALREEDRIQKIPNPVQLGLVNSTIDHVVNGLADEPLIEALPRRIGIHSGRFMNRLEMKWTPSFGQSDHDVKQWAVGWG